MDYFEFARILKDNLIITGFGSAHAEKSFKDYIDAMVGKVAYQLQLKEKLDKE